MLHPLAATEIAKLRQHGVTGLTYDEVASLQELALAVDAAAHSEGLPTGLTRPIVLGPGDDQILWPPTCAGLRALGQVDPWLPGDEAEASVCLAWILAHGRDLAALERATLTRGEFRRAVEAWRNALPVSIGELAGAVRALFDAQDDAGFRLDGQVFERVAGHAEAAGDAETAERVRALWGRLAEKRRKETAPSRARTDWGLVTLRLAALTGCPPDTWLVRPSAEAVEAYAGVLDFEALKAGAKGDSAPQRAQRDALRALFEATDAIARAHAAKPPKEN